MKLSTTPLSRSLTLAPLVMQSLTVAVCALLAIEPLSTRAATVNVDVGLEKPVVVDNSKPVKLAVFIETASNSAVQSTIEGAREKAKQYGFAVSVFDAHFDVATQLNQMQNALLAGYNAWLVVPVEGSQLCDTVAKTAPQANVLVALATGAACGRSSNEGEALWAPGTLTYVGGNETPDAFKAVMMRAINDGREPQRVGVLTGPNLHPITVSFDKALDEVTKENPQFKVVAKYRTDYSPADNLAKTQAMLQAHPDITVIIGAYTNMSKGAVPAIQSAGKTGKIRVYEAGGTKWSVNALSQGSIQATTGFYRRTAAETAVQAILDARAGKKVARVFLNDGHALIPGQAPGSVGIVTNANVSSYQPESP
ncbi:sugar ABC transporter substrate-binding protein [Paraburkholderia phymatum]|uniref:sugar ABC transporter substrate-binding protein n=1 Tax=Paraburkholderia phymatum TaxID=148447 RepID=UPI00317FA559